MVSLMGEKGKYILNLAVHKRALGVEVTKIKIFILNLGRMIKLTGFNAYGIYFLEKVVTKVRRKTVLCPIKI